MAMRDLVTGGAACAVPGSSSSSNPFGALANAILGPSMKAQDLKGLPESQVTVPDVSSDLGVEAQLKSIPGSEYENQMYQQSNAQTSEFLRGFRAGGRGSLEDAWEEVQRFPLLPNARNGEGDVRFAEFEQIFEGGVNGQTLDGPPHRVLSSFLHYFVNSDRHHLGFRPTALPALGLSQSDKRCIRDRSCIMARHIFADKSEQYINEQVSAFLHCLDIDNDHLVRGPLQGPYAELEEHWNSSQAVSRPLVPHPADSWISEFSQQRENGDPEAWAYSFEKQHGANGWVSEFQQEQSQMALTGQLGSPNLSNIAAMEQTRMLAHTLAQNSDPKFQNSKFLQFVSKMSRGELIVDDNQIKPATQSVSGDWANEFQMQHSTGSRSWVDQFVHEQLPQGTNDWVGEFVKERLQDDVDDQWVSEFSKLNVQDWAEEFGQQVADGTFGESAADNWADAYDEYLDEQLASKSNSRASRGVYVFSDMNPYVGHPNPLKEGQELFRKGLLSEAVLALEAEVLKNPDNAEGWRLLGITHAENDDDQQAIASMMRAQEVDPTNLEVLLALGVSYTNELEQEEALKYLYKWLQNHPKYRAFAPPESSSSLFHTDIARLFNEAAQMSPEDADVHIVLGVMYNVSREYDKAIQSFERALKLKPHDYSLWNKLGATQANSVHSEDAILAYQQALDLKPNYVRAWANMGISYANQGRYEESVRYYVRALAMNPKADNAWQYLKISLRFASRTDMLEACDARNLDVLQKEFPL